MTNEPGWGGVWKSALGWDSKAKMVKLVRDNPSGEIRDAVKFARERLGFEPDEEQARALRGGRRGIVQCTRQWGKSTVMSAKAVHRACFVPGSLILVLTPCGRQSGEFLRKAEAFVRRLGIPVRRDGNNELSLAFPNGSRIVGLPENESKVRGFSNVSLMLIDEAARVNDDLYRAMRPTLAVGDGDLWLMSTPNGKPGFFYEEWAHGGDACERSGWRRRTVRGSRRGFWRRSGRRKAINGTARNIFASSWRGKGLCFRRSRLMRLCRILSRWVGITLSTHPGRGEPVRQ